MTELPNHSDVRILGGAWVLTGWRPNEWRLRHDRTLGLPAVCDFGPLLVELPTSVNAVLHSTGDLPDPWQRTSSRQHEWVEHRDWLFEYDLTAPAGTYDLIVGPSEHPLFVLLDGEIFSHDVAGPWTSRIRLKLTGPCRLGIVMQPDPSFVGQLTYSSAIETFRPRFSYGWDWTPRHVPVGLSFSPTLVAAGLGDLEDLRTHIMLDGDLAAGTIVFRGSEPRLNFDIVVELIDPDGDLSGVWRGPADQLAIRVAQPRLWWPNGFGAQPLYTLRISALHSSAVITRRVGFRSITWTGLPDAPADSLDWQCQVNAVPVFLQGVNWTPIRSTPSDVTPADYRLRLDRYRDLGATVVRVWGGAYIEADTFYDLCDEMGLLVWQDLPFSSSGLDNAPAATHTVLSGAARAADAYGKRLHYRPSLLLFCGGNELQTAPDGSPGAGLPITTGHRVIAAMHDVLERYVPAHRFIPASPTGPTFTAEPADFGSGLHHEVHGPWFSPTSWPQWRSYWDNDDAIMRSEVGCQGASPAEIIRRYAGAEAWPAHADNPVWRHLSPWWHDAELQHPQTAEARTLEEFVASSQLRQARGLAYAAAASRARPGCGGFLIWMGHDVWPCPVNTSILDVFGDPKPAFESLRSVFHTSPAQLAKALRNGQEPWLDQVPGFGE